MRWAWAVSIVVFAASPAAASQWWIVLQRDGAGNVHLADTEQLRRTGDLVTFWSHLFYREEIDGMKSARVQYEANCRNFSIRERRYLDFDANQQVVESGDNTAHDGWREVAPDTSGAKYVEFACATSQQRHDSFLSVDPTVDIFALADFYLDPRPIVAIPSSPPPSEPQQ